MKNVPDSPLRLVDTPMPEEERLKAVLNSLSGEGKAASKISGADQLADELAFKKRFGFSMNSAQRKSLLGLKAEFDLTDDEIKHMKRTSSLKITAKAVELNASREAAIAAQLYIVVLSLIVATIWWFATTNVLKGGNVIMALTFIVCFLLVAKYFRWACIKPWQLQKRLIQEL